jgi:hypothetical protein
MRFISRSKSDSDLLSNHTQFSTCTIKTLRDMAEVATKKVWSPIIWKDGARNTKNYLFSDYCVLDFDSSMQLPEAYDSFKDYQCFIATTVSHQKRKNGHISDRFRVVIPWEKRIDDVNLYRANMENLINHYESDEACKDGGRLYKPSPKIVFVNEGDLMPVKNIKLKEYADNVIPMAPPKIMPGWLQDKINRGVCGNEGRNAAGFKIAADLYRHGYSENEVFFWLKKSFGVNELNDRELKSIARSAKKITAR